MKQHIRPYLLYIYVILLAGIIAGCSSQKNTASSRWWHSFNTRYNTYYNGAQAYIDGSLEKETGNKDNFTEMIPLYTVSNKDSKEIGKANFDRAIEKAQKSIARHSIKKRPEWTKNRRKTEKDIEWLSRKEYNPFLWKAWMLMGRSQFHKGAFDEAAATFSYMSRIYKTQPAIYGKARAWLAKCYIEEGWTYDAEDVIRNMSRDSIDWRAVKEWDYTYADYYIHTNEFEKAIPYLRKVIKHEMRRKQKAREWYLMGQLQAALGHNNEAFKAFKNVIRQNPPYELEFNARIAMTEVMAKGKTKQMVSKLKRMAASDKNKDYLDQVYYAMGNIYLAEKDTASAINAYEKGNEKSTRSGIEKGVLLLHLGDLYWEKEKFSDAKRCYGTAIGLLDKDRKDYKQLSERSKVLDNLVPFTDAIHLQDSLQYLAKCPEEERNAAIDRVIEALKKKEKEEKRKQAEQEAAQAQGQGNNTDQKNNQKQNTQTNQTNKNSVWYFYNPTAVQQGKATFEKQWGKRENADNWQRANKTVVGNVGSAELGDDLTDEQRDSIAAAEAKEDSLSQKSDSAQNDPHKREYYLAQIPFTPEQLEASNKILEDGLHHAGVIFKDDLDNLPLAEKELRRLDDNYPEYEKMDEVFYHLFLLYNRKNRPDIADTYVDKLKEKYPESQWTILLTDPYFVENAKFGAHIEDSLYTATYEAFQKDRFHEVEANTRISKERFPLGANRDKFLFIGGLSKLNNNDADGCVSDMKEVVSSYPNSRISEMAGMIVNGVNSGKRLRGGKFDLGDIWSRRTDVLNDSDSIKQVQFTPDREIDFNFLMVYHPDSLNENKLLFEMARFNFSSFLVRNFDVEIVDEEGMRVMKVSGFRNFDETYQYTKQLFASEAIKQLTHGKVIPILISDKNKELIGKPFTYADYADFYAKHFSAVKISNVPLLFEPAEVVSPKRNEQSEASSGEDNADGIIVDPTSNAPSEESGFIIPDEETAPEAKADSTATQPNEVIALPETTPEKPEAEKVEEGISIPVEQPAPAEKQETPNSEGLFIPIEEAPSTTKQPTKEDEEVIPVETPEPIVPEKKQPVVEQHKPEVVTPKQEPVTPKQEPAASKPSQEKPQPQTEVKKEPQEEPQPTIQPNEEPLEDEPDIYFDDEVTPSTSNKKQQNTNSGNVDDEYYELDGF